MRTNRFEPHPAAVAKDRIRQILALTLRANHNGNQSQLGRIVPNSFKPGLSVHREGSKQCIVPGYAKSKLRDCDTIDNRLTTGAHRTMQKRTYESVPGPGSATRSMMMIEVLWSIVFWGMPLVEANQLVESEIADVAVTAIYEVCADERIYFVLGSTRA